MGIIIILLKKNFQITMLANLNEVIIDGNHDGVGYGHRYVNIDGNHDHVRLMNLYDNVAPVATPSHGGHGIYTGNEGRGIGEIHHHGGHNEGRGIGRIATPSYSNNLGAPITNITDYVAQFEKNIETYCKGHSDSAVCMKLMAGMDKTSALYNPLDGNHGACFPGAPGFPNCEAGFPGTHTIPTTEGGCYPGSPYFPNCEEGLIPHGNPVITTPVTTPTAVAWVPTAAEKTYEAANPTYAFDPARPWTLPAMEDWVPLQKSGVAHPSRPFSQKYGYEPYLMNLNYEHSAEADAKAALDEAKKLYKECTANVTCDALEKKLIAAAKKYLIAKCNGNSTCEAVAKDAKAAIKLMNQPSLQNLYGSSHSYLML